MEELLELEAPEAAGSRLAVARDRRGLYIAKAPRALRVQAGDRLVGARILFEGAPPEVVARLLEGAACCRVLLCVRRRAPGTGSGTAPPPPIPTLPKKPPTAPAVELVLPKLPKLGKSRSEAEPEPVPPGAPIPVPARPRLTVKEAAGGRAMEQPPLEPEPPGGARFPALEVAVPGLPVPEPPAKASDGATFGGFRLRSVSIPALELLPRAEPPEGTGAAKPRPPRFALPRVGLALGKGGPGTPEVPKPLRAPVSPPPGRRRAPSLPKLPLGPELGLKLPRFGGSSPDLRSGLWGGTDPKAVPGSPGPLRALLAPGPDGANGTGAGGGLKVPGLELAPPGLEAEPGRWGGLKLPRFGTGTGTGRRSIPPPRRRSGEGKALRWVPRVGFSPPTPPSPPRKGGGLRIPELELCPPGPPQLHAGTPKLSPALCGGAR